MDITWLTIGWGEYALYGDVVGVEPRDVTGTFAVDTCQVELCSVLRISVSWSFPRSRKTVFSALEKATNSGTGLCYCQAYKGEEASQGQYGRGHSDISEQTLRI